jgi:hypothetical protein
VKLRRASESEIVPLNDLAARIRRVIAEEIDRILPGEED